MDLRSLAVFRVAVSLLIIADLLMRAAALWAHYTDSGLLPRGALAEEFSSPWRFSVHLIGGTTLIQAVLFLLNGLFAFMLLIGYRTRLATFLTWFFMISLHARNPFILQGGDILLRMLLFWSLFLPLGAWTSVDSVLRHPSKTMSKNIVSMATAAYFAQIVFLYWFSAAHKLSPEALAVWWKEGTAVYYTLSIDQLATPFGHFLLRFPWLMRILNYEVLFLEVAGPFFLISPIFNYRTRLISIFLLMVLQLGFGLCLALGPFPWVCSIAMLPFLPSFFWDRLFSIKFFEQGYSRLSRLGNKFCRYIAGNPFIFSKSLSSGSTPLRLSLGGNAFVLFSLIYVFCWNLDGFNAGKVIPDKFRWFGMSLGLDQRWGMFAPPLTGDGWYVAPGKLKSGKEIDVLNHGKPVAWEKPALLSAAFPNLRWRKYMMDLWLPENYDRRVHFGKYLCRNWNNRHPEDERLESFEIFYMLERTEPPPQPSEIEKILLWQHWCFELPPEAEPLKADLSTEQPA